MAAEITPTELADLLVETGHRHHEAYRSSDGVDPEWALWYAGFLQARIWYRVGAVPTRSALVHLLVEAELRFEPTGEFPEWPPFYARLMLDQLLASSSDG